MFRAVSVAHSIRPVVAIPSSVVAVREIRNFLAGNAVEESAVYC